MDDSRALIERLHATRARVARAAAAAGREPSEIRLLGVSKQHSVAAIRALAHAGLQEFGESYLQEALPKLETLKSEALTWHYIGQLQSNKTRPIAEHFDWVHTIDRERAAQRLSAQRPHYAPALQVCIQVKLAEEPGKGGVDPQQVLSLAQSIRGLPRLKLRGLMSIPPAVESFAEQRSYFDRLTALLDSLKQQGMDVDTLSMGMSSDLEAAVQAGATIVRIGTALFGERSR